MHTDLAFLILFHCIEAVVDIRGFLVGALLGLVPKGLPMEPFPLFGIQVSLVILPPHLRPSPTHS